MVLFLFVCNEPFPEVCQGTHGTPVYIRHNQHQDTQLMKGMVRSP